MPIVKVINSNYFNTTSNYNPGGTQYIDGVLTLPTAPDATTIYLSNDIYYKTGDYVLFDYSGSTEVTPVVGSLSQVLFNLDDLTISDFAYLTNNTSEKKIILTVRGKADNGTQYITGILDISAPMTIELGTVMFNAPGTYTLFDWSGGGSFIGNVSNITISPPSGRSIDPSHGVNGNGCALSGSTITFKLI